MVLLKKTGDYVYDFFPSMLDLKIRTIMLNAIAAGGIRQRQLVAGKIMNIIHFNLEECLIMLFLVYIL